MIPTYGTLTGDESRRNGACFFSTRDIESKIENLLSNREMEKGTGLVIISQAIFVVNAGANSFVLYMKVTPYDFKIITACF